MIKLKRMMSVVALASIVGMGGCKKETPTVPSGSFVTAAPTPTTYTPSPTPNAINVVDYTPVFIGFKIAMDSSTINTTTFTLSHGSNIVVGKVKYLTDIYGNYTAAFVPSAPFFASTTYSAVLTTGAKSLAGVPLAADVKWNFTTRAQGQ